MYNTSNKWPLVLVWINVKQLAAKTAMCDDMRLQITGLRERVAKAEASKTTSNKLTIEHTF